VTSIVKRRHNRTRGQAMVEFALIAPVFLVIVFGALMLFLWLLDVDSAQFAAEEGIQAAASPTQVVGNTGFLCGASVRAYDSLLHKSFIRTTTLIQGSTNCDNAAAIPPVTGLQPDYTAGNSCPSTGLQSYSSMLNWLNTHAGSSKDVVIICASCIDLSQLRTPDCQPPTVVKGTDELQLQVTVAGYKPIAVSLPVVGSRIPYYGQDTQTVQAFQCTPVPPATC